MDETSFYGLSVLTAPGHVMIPRVASEQLVATALDILGDRPVRVADVGTGSGALAIAIASEAPRAALWATDTSRSAVELARANVELHGLSHQVAVRQGDLLDPVPGSLDLVVANLPYLPAADAALHPDLSPEPHEAVFAPGDGLDPYRRLLAACTERLSAGGHLVIQLHRRVLAAARSDLLRLGADLEHQLVGA
jgi:release factor glutamine methyltransferase